MKMPKYILDEEDTTYLYKDMKTGTMYYFDGEKLVPINAKQIRDAEERDRNINGISNETPEEEVARQERARAKLADERIAEKGISKARNAAYKARQNAREKERQDRLKKERDDLLTRYPKGAEQIRLSIKDFIEDQVKERIR